MRCNIQGCDQPRCAESKFWCASHRALFRQVGGAEPDPLHALIVNARAGHYVMSVVEIAAALGCAPEQVRERLAVLKAAGKARSWLPGRTLSGSVISDDVHIPH